MRIAPARSENCTGARRRALTCITGALLWERSSLHLYFGLLVTTGLTKENGNRAACPRGMLSVRVCLEVLDIASPRTLPAWRKRAGRARKRRRVQEAAGTIGAMPGSRAAVSTCT